MRHSLPSEIEEYRDSRWGRETATQVETLTQAESFIERNGFAACLTDASQPGPSLYIAVCGRRDAIMPRHVQKDPESSNTWMLKDSILRRGRIYYGKLPRGKTMFIAPRLVPYFNTLWGVSRSSERRQLTRPALAILRVLRTEWEMGTSDLQQESGLKDRKVFLKALDELQASMLVIPNDVIYEPRFSYLWGLAEERFPESLSRKKNRLTALREIARSFLDGAGMTVPGELARFTGLSRPDAGLGNRALVKEGYAVMLAPGMYKLTKLG